MPEEINRVLTDHLSTLLLCPTETAVVNLRREGIIDGVHNIGDVMYDAACFAAAASGRSQILDRLGLVERSYAVATVHRAESTESKAALAEIVDVPAPAGTRSHHRIPGPPRTRKRIAEWRLDLGEHTERASRSVISDMHRLLQIGGCGLHRFRRLAKGSLFPQSSLRNVAQRDRVGGDH